MCGIIGSFLFKKNKNYDLHLQESLRLLHHRGPDNNDREKHILNDGILDLCHTRLSIIDLTSSGNQPMRSSDGRYSIIFKTSTFELAFIA